MSDALTACPALAPASQPIVTVVDGSWAAGSEPEAAVSVTTQLLPAGIPFMVSLSALVAPLGMVTVMSCLFRTSVPSKVQTALNVKVPPSAKGTTPCPETCLVTVRLPLAT